MKSKKRSLDPVFFCFARIYIFVLSMITFTKVDISFTYSLLFYLDFLFFSIDIIMYVISCLEVEQKSIFIQNSGIYIFQIIKAVTCLFLKDKYSMFQYEFAYSVILWTILIYKNTFFVQTYNSENKFWKSYLIRKEKFNNWIWKREIQKVNITVLRKNVLYCLTFLLLMAVLGVEYRSHWILFCYIFTFTLFIPTVIIFSYSLLDFETIIPRCRLEFFIRELANFRVRFISWILPYLALLFYPQKDSLAFIVIILSAFCYLVSYESIVQRSSTVKFSFKDILPVLFKILTLASVYFFINNFYKLFDSNFYITIKKTIPSVVIPIISAVFIFNFSATIYLLQENYHKFNSIFLLKKVLNPLGLIITIILPAIFAILILIDIIPSVEMKINFSIVAIEYSLLSSLYLLYMFRFYLDVRKVFLYIIGNTNPLIILDFKEQNYEDAENEISTIKNIICSSISNSDVVIQENCYPLFFTWIKQNIDFFYTQSKYVPEIEHNGFRKMMFDINESFTGKTKFQVRRNYIEYIYRLFIEIEFSDLQKYSLFYDTLADFAIKCISKKRDNSDSINFALDAIAYKIPEYLNGIKVKENERIFVRGSNDYILFEDVVLKNWKSVFRSINEIDNHVLKQNVFSHLHISYIFKRYDNVDNENDWTMIHVTCFTDLLDMMNNITMTNINDSKIIRHFIFEYVTLGYIFKNVKLEKKENRYMFNTFMNHLGIFFQMIIESDLELNEFDFEVFYQPCWDLTENKKIIIDYLNLFIFFIRKYFDKLNKIVLSEKSKENVFRIWRRTDQLLEIWDRKHLISEEIITFWTAKQKETKEKYDDLLSGYEDYLQKEKELAKRWQKVMKDF